MRRQQLAAVSPTSALPPSPPPAPPMLLYPGETRAGADTTERAADVGLRKAQAQAAESAQAQESPQGDAPSLDASPIAVSPAHSPFIATPPAAPRCVHVVVLGCGGGVGVGGAGGGVHGARGAPRQALVLAAAGMIECSISSPRATHGPAGGRPPAAWCRGRVAGRKRVAVARRSVLRRCGHEAVAGPHAHVKSAACTCQECRHHVTRRGREAGPGYRARYRARSPECMDAGSFWTRCCTAPLAQA